MRPKLSKREEHCHFIVEGEGENKINFYLIIYLMMNKLINLRPAYISD